MPVRSSRIRARRLEARRDRNGRALKRGDKIRVAGIPQGLVDEEGPETQSLLKTKTIFELCLGRTFRIVSFQGDGVHDDWIELHAGHVVGEKSYKHSIYIEPSLVELVEPPESPESH